jgi:hypothetical protein
VSVVEEETQHLTPASTRDLIQGSGDVAEATASTRAVEAMGMPDMEVGMEATVDPATTASATTLATKEPVVVAGPMAAAMVVGEDAVVGRTTEGRVTIKTRCRHRTPWQEAIPSSTRTTWEGIPSS